MVFCSYFSAKQLKVIRYLRSWELYFCAPELRTEKIRHSSSSHQVVIKQSSDSHQAVIKLLFSKTAQCALLSEKLSTLVLCTRAEHWADQVLIKQSSRTHQAVVKNSSGSHQIVIMLSSNSFLVKQPSVHRYKRSWALYFRAPELSSWLQYTHATAATVVVYQHTLLVSCSEYPRDKLLTPVLRKMTVKIYAIEIIFRSHEPFQSYLLTG